MAPSRSHFRLRKSWASLSARATCTSHRDEFQARSWKKIKCKNHFNIFVTRPLCLVESHTLDAARRVLSLFTSLTFCKVWAVAPWDRTREYICIHSSVFQLLELFAMISWHVYFSRLPHGWSFPSRISFKDWQLHDRLHLLQLSNQQAKQCQYGDFSLGPARQRHYCHFGLSNSYCQADAIFKCSAE